MVVSNAEKTSYELNNNIERIVFPSLPKEGQDNQFELEVFSHFIGHLRQVPNSRVEIKILSSIHFTADMLNTSDALISKTLVDMGLRAPRKAFPVSFLDFVDRAIKRTVWDNTSPAISVLNLKEHWKHIGEDRFSTESYANYARNNETVYANA